MSLLEKTPTVVVDRKPMRFDAKRNSYTYGSSNVRIELDVSEHFIDFQSGVLQYELVFTNVDATTTLTKWAGGNIIKKLRIKTLNGNEIGREISDYNAVQKMLYQTGSNSDVNESFLRILEGGAKTGDNASGQFTTAAQYIVSFAHKIQVHLPSIKEYYPAHFHQGLIIEFDMPSDAAALFNYPTNAPTGISIQNVRYKCDIVKLDASVENMMLEMYKNEDLVVDYVEASNTSTELANSSGQQAINIIGIEGRVKRAFTYFILDSNQTGTGTEYFEKKAQLNLSNYRYKLGEQYMNHESIRCDETATKFNRAEQLHEFMRAMDLQGNDALKTRTGDSNLGGALIDNAADPLKTDFFVLGCKMDKEQVNVDSFISSRVDKLRNNLRLELDFSSAPGVATAYTHIFVDKRIKLIPGAGVVPVRSG